MLKEIKNIICFYTGSKQPSDIEEAKAKKEEDLNYEDYLTLACDERGYKLVWLNKRYISFTYYDHVIDILDLMNNISFSLNHNNTENTIIFQGQSNDDMPDSYIQLMKSFELEGFTMFNTIDEINIASDKYRSSILLSSKNLSQPNYIFVNNNILQTNDNIIKNSFWKLLDTIYPEGTNIDKGPKEYVIKILGGSLGIGVSMCTKDEIASIMQAMFAIDPDLGLIVQEYKENTGDIRVHLFSIDKKNYEVIACMKRNKIKGDFRSNVSLGATTDTYQLTKEEENLVKDVAKISGLRWVGVDLMACEDGSNVVIEYNSSPGVEGISKQMKKNMFSIILDIIRKHIEDNTKDNKEDNKQ